MASMIPNVISNLTHHPRTRLYPYEVRNLPARARGHIEFDMDKCILCGLCAKKCPADAIKVDRKEKTLTFSPLQCIVCGVCVQGCVKGAAELYEQWGSPVTARFNKIYQKPDA